MPVDPGKPLLSQRLQSIAPPKAHGAPLSPVGYASDPMTKQVKGGAPFKPNVVHTVPVKPTAKPYAGAAMLTRQDFGHEVLPDASGNPIHPKLSARLKAVAPVDTRLAEAKTQRAALATQGLTPEYVATHTDAQVAQFVDKHSAAKRQEHVVKDAAFFSLHPGTPSLFDRFVSDLADAAIGMPAGAVKVGEAGFHDSSAIAQGHVPTHLYSDVGVPMAKSFVQSVEHPLRHPGFTALNATALVGGVAGAAGRVGALGEASAALRPLAEGDVAAAAKVPLEHQYHYWPKGVATHFAKTGELPKVTTAALKTQLVKTALRTPRPHDVVTDEGIVRPGAKSPLGDVRRQLPGALGRDLRAQTNIETGLLQAPGHAVENLTDTVPGKTGRLAERIGLPKKLTVGRGKLSKYQEHAAFIDLSGHTPAEWAQASEYAIENADALAQELEPHGDAAMIARVADEIRSNHASLLQMTKNAGQYFDENGKLSHTDVVSASKKIRALTAQREKLIGMDETAVHHSLGSHWFALDRLLGGHDYHGELARLQEHAVQGPPRSYERVGDKLDTQARIDQIHELFRQKGAESGASYLPYQSKRAPLLSRQGLGQVSRGASRYGMGPVKGEAVHAFEGKSLVRGDIRTKASTLASGAYRRAAKIAAQEELHSRLWSLAKTKRASKTDVPIRDTLKIPDHLREDVNRLYEGGLTPTEENALTRNLWEENTKEPQAGEHVRFVPSSLYKQTAKPISPNAFMRNLDRLGTTYRATRYLTPLYGKWFAQNGGLGVVQQGIFLPANMVGFLKGFRDLPEGDIHLVEAGMGGGVGKSLTEGTTSHIVHSLAEFWHNVDDRVFRGASFWHEAGREGFKTPDDIHRLLTDEALSAKKIAVFRRARDEALDYTLTPKERALIKPLFAWYPWLKAATRWAFTFPAHHPVQTDVYAQLGAEADNRTQDFFKSLGGLEPSWMAGDIPHDGTGRFTVGGLGPAETPVGVGQALVDTLKGRYHPLESELNLNPVLQAGISLVHGTDARGNKTTLPDVGRDFLTDRYAMKYAKDIAHGKAGWDKTGFVPYATTDFPTAARQGASEQKARLRGVDQVNAYTEANLRALHATPLNAQAAAQVKQAIILDARYSTEMIRAGAKGDTPYDAIQTLAYKDPKAYYLATVRALPGVTPEAVAAQEQMITAAIATGTYTAKDITNAADALWQKTGVWHVLAQWRKLTAPKLGG